MKVINDIGLQLDYQENLNTSKQYTLSFSFRCRFIGNYLRRQVKLSKFEPKGYHRISINACQLTIPENKIFESWLCVYIPFNKDYYNSLTKEELPDFFLKMYREGIIKAQQTHELPMQFLLDKLIELKQNNYKNEWEFKSRTFKELGVKATLLCKMTMDNFSLSLILSRKTEVVFRREILNALPDETIYNFQFKDIILENNEIKVINEFNEPIYVLDLNFNV